jgi:glutathione reductase (NADPH)
MSDFDLDFFVIGGGSGGVRAARIAAGYGARVMVAEEHRVGGTCVIRGCVPKKLMVYASHVRQEINDAAGFGWNIPTAQFDWRTFLANKDKEIARLEAAYAANLDKAGVNTVKSRAVLETPNCVRLSNGTKLTSRYVLVATGATPHLGDRIPGIEHVISSNEAFELAELPRRVLIQGGGYIALEFAGIFAGLGSEVTVVCRAENVLRGFDEDVRSHVRAELEKQGITVVHGRRVTAVEKMGGELLASLSDGSIVPADQVMFATGRRPNTANIGLEEVGVEVNASSGAIIVDDFSRTSVPNIYAVGDVTNRIALTPVAIREGHAVADTLFGGRPTPVKHADVPTAVFTQPEVGTVGLTESQARAQFKSVDIYKTVFRPMKTTISGRNTRILMKLVVDQESERLLGCHIVGDAAAEIIQIVAVAVKMGATKSHFDVTIALHPSAAEELVTMRTPSARYVREPASLLPSEDTEVLVE